MGFHDGGFPVKTNQKKQSEAFLVKGAFFKSAIRRLDKFFVILKPIKVLSVADPRPNQVGVRFSLVSVSLRSRFGLVSVLFRRKTILTAARKRPPLARWPRGLTRPLKLFLLVKFLIFFS